MKIVGITACPTGIAHTYITKKKIIEARLHYFSNTRLFLLLNKLYTLGVTFISFVFSFGHAHGLILE